MVINRKTLITLLLTLTFISAACLVLPVKAGPITNPGGQPYTKLGVYAGTLSVVIDANGLEFGARGTDIVGTAEINIRPYGLEQSTTVKHGATIKQRAPGQTGLYVSGQVCIYPAGPAAAPDCRTAWPTGGTASLWTKYTDTEGFSVVAPNSSVGHAVIGRLTYVSDRPALTVTQANANYSALEVGNIFPGQTGKGLLLDGNAIIPTSLISGTTYNQFAIAGNVYVNSGGMFYQLYSMPAQDQFGEPGYQGLGSGFDGDTLDGYQVTIENATACVNTENYTAQACLCFHYGGSVGTRCMALKNWH